MRILGLNLIETDLRDSYRSGKTGDSYYFVCFAGAGKINKNICLLESC